MTELHRQQYGLGSFVKKIAKGAKKIVKSPVGKAALLGLGAYGLGGAGFLGGKGVFASGQGLQRFRNLANIGSAMRTGLFGNVGGPANMYGKPGLISKAWGGAKKFGLGKSALLGLGAAGMALPFFAGKGDDEEEEGESWSITPSSIADIRMMARKRDPSLAFMPNQNYVQSGYYLKDGGIAGLANGGNPAEAQAEQMLKMEYQKYRNQGGTMSYQQFKMAVLQQAQGQGPMAQGQQAPQGYANGELVTDESMMAETPTGMMEENIEEVQGEPTREEMEALAMEIFQLRLEELDEEQLMVVYQAAMEQQPQEEMMQEEDVQFAANGGLMGTHVPGYTTPAGHNKWGYRTGGVRVGKAEGGIMDLGGMEKDYRNEGGFVALGGKERADDVPARLSKNEFVFTADAVRAAGAGDIDQGAEVMQNVMENLEQGGQISEESQGAQGMYNNMQQLQSRMA
jgi:hypothetical protein